MKIKENKITFVTPTLGLGGAENVIRLLSNQLVFEKYDITIICLMDRKIEQKLDYRIKLITPKIKLYNNKLGKILYKLLLTFWLRKKLRNQKGPIISFQAGYNNLILLSSIFLKKNIYVSDRSNPYKNIGFYNNLLRKILYPFAKGVICQTQDSLNFVKDHKLNKNPFILRNPVKIIPNLNLQKEKIILSVGRLVPEKKHSDLIKIFDYIPSPWELHIVGSGPLQNSLEKQIKESKNSNRIRLFKATDNLAKFFSKSTIFAFTSESEGYPNSLCEAMAFPLPVICFDCNSGPRDIITFDVNGYIIKGRSINEYVEKLIELTINENKREKFMRESLYIREENSVGKICTMLIEKLSE